MLRRLLLGPRSPFPSSDHKRRPYPQPRQLGHPDAGGRIQRGCESSRSVRLLTPSDQAASSSLPYSSSCHEAFACIALTSLRPKGGWGQGTMPSINFLIIIPSASRMKPCFYF